MERISTRKSVIPSSKKICFNQEERKFITLFRQLPPPRKATVLGVMEDMVAVEKFIANQGGYNG